MTAAAGHGGGDPRHSRPDGRALSRWRDQLAALGPRELWVGTLDLCHLDAAVRLSRRSSLDPFHRHLLAAVSIPGMTRDTLHARLGMGPMLGRWLDELRDADLVRYEGDRIVVTPRGEGALIAGTYPQPASERRRFTFVLAGPHYLPWLAAPGPHDPSVGVAEIGWVAECVSRPAEWKRRAAFPEDVQSVESVPPESPPWTAWRRLAVAHSERVAVVLATTGSGELYAFVPDPAGGLHTDAPALRMAHGWRDPFPELAVADDSLTREDVGDGWRLVGGGRLRRAIRTES